MKMRTLLGIFCMLTSLLSYSQTNQSTNITIKGQVVDSLTNETVPFATLKIVEKDNPTKTVKAVASDDNGNFKLSIDKKDGYVMVIQYIGKTDVSRELQIGEQKTIDFGKILMADNETTLKAVEVSAQRPLVKVDLDKITYNIEEDPESKTNNVLEMLKKVPMVTVNGEEEIQLKGSSNFKIYMNGKPSNMISNNPKDVLKSMPANTVKDIEIITDPGAKYDAEGVAGIINIITHKQSSLGGYTATLNGGADSRGGYNGGVYTAIKYGKIGFTGSYNYYTYKRPRGESVSSRENFINNGERYLFENGTSKYNGNGQYGSGELSFEIDTLNLINVGYNRYEGNSKNYGDVNTRLEDINNVLQYEYDRSTVSKNKYGGTDLNADYQRTFNKKDQLLTFSYRLGLSPSDRDSNGDLDIRQGNPSNVYTNRQYTNAKSTEHTFQGDFTTPFGKIHTLEAGIKYIIRNNNSNSGLENWIPATNSWTPQTSYNDNFKHRNDIIASYLGYSARVKKWGFKTGLRFESTQLDVKYPLSESLGINPSPDFKADYNNWVPSATITYQLKPSQSLRLGYNMRISRPGIWQLNPYEDTSNPNYISKGNPNLDAVESHSINTNYMFFNPKLNLNLSANYNFENNSIENITEVQNDISIATYKNIGKSKNLNMSAYVNYSPNAKFRIYSNIWGGYTDVKANDTSGLSNHGFNIGLYGGLQYTTFWNIRTGLNSGYFGRNVELQGEQSSFYFYSFSLMRSFLSDRLTFNAYLQNPFNDTFKYKNKMETPAFRYESSSTQFRRQFGLRVSFRFGEMKAQIKKAQRGIQNDDTMSGGQGQQSGGQGQQGN